MADIKLVKTNDINKVPHKENQLIFCDDGSMYFDYNKSLRLHNSDGAKLLEFEPGKSYQKGELCIYNSGIYRAIEDTKSDVFDASKWEPISFGSGEGTINLDATQITINVDGETEESLHTFVTNLSEDVDALKESSVTIDTPVQIGSF